MLIVIGKGEMSRKFSRIIGFLAVRRQVCPKAVIPAEEQRNRNNPLCQDSCLRRNDDKETKSIPH